MNFSVTPNFEVDFRLIAFCQANGGYGCWIGFEDSAAEGGFVWTDGSSVDFVNFAPGEPNGGTRESAVTLDMRGDQGIITSSGQARHGMWNDDQRTDTYLLHPICETTIPQARPGGIRSWGSGNSHSVNIKVCVDADDYLFFQVRPNAHEGPTHDAMNFRIRPFEKSFLRSLVCL